jgi:ubiquinone/menaquinone biosynthesis C-methylase UbiE
MAAGALGKAYDATWGRAFARFYDRALKATEENGLGAMRAELLAEARGRVIEVGAGTGVNIGLYGSGIEDLTLVEPDPHMAAQLRKRLEEGGGAPKHLVEAPAEHLPFAHDTFHTAVATLVLCTIPDPAAAIAEMARVLKPGGRLLYIEHVRSDDPDRARWQDRLEKPWRFMADGCYCNRDTESSLRASAFALETVEYGKLPKAMPIVRPLIRGTAVLNG